MTNSKISSGFLIGLDIGGTVLRLALANTEGELVLKKRSALYREPGENILDALYRAIDSLLDGTPRSKLLGIGAAVAGPVDRTLGEVVNPPHLEQGKRIPLKAAFEERFEVPVVLENDANAAALAEHRRGAGIGVGDMVYMTVSTGIGGGLILGGSLYRGALGGAGEVGHIVLVPDGLPCDCGSRGCLETVASGTAIAREAVVRLHEGKESLLLNLASGAIESINAEMIHEAALQGDSLSQEVIRDAAYFLGLGLASIVNIFNPALIVLGGGVTNMGDMLLKPATKLARERSMPLASGAVRFKLSHFGDDAGLVGALILMEEELAPVSA